MNSTYLKASLVTAVAASLILFGFLKWKERTFASEGVNLVNTLDRMEKDGLPSFEAADFYGKKFDLKSVQGKVVILNFWASWCGPCVEEFPSMIKLLKSVGPNLQLVAVSQDDSLEDAKAFLKSFPEAADLENLHLIFDPDRGIGRLYNVERLPESYIADKKNRLAKKVVGSIEWNSEDALSYMKGLVDAP